MAIPYVIIVTGHPASGKTTLARRLAADLALPCLARDDIKEILFNTLGWSDREWSKKLGRAAYELMYLFSEKQLSVRRSFLLEFNFESTVVTPRFRELESKYKFYPIQVILEADAPILLERFMQRAESSERHPGNVDHLLRDEFRRRLEEGPYQHLSIGGTVLRVNTNDFARVNYQTVHQQIQSLLSNL